LEGQCEPFNGAPDKIPAAFIHNPIIWVDKRYICPIIMAVDLYRQGSMTLSANQDDNVLTCAIRGPMIGASAQIRLRHRAAGGLQVERLDDIQADINKGSL
jgi:hypothetical protein